MTRVVMIEQSGLPEYEGATYVNVWGYGVGNTLKEVCEDVILGAPEKAKYFKVHESGACTDWGFRLFLLPEFEEPVIPRRTMAESEMARPTLGRRAPQGIPAKVSIGGKK